MNRCKTFPASTVMTEFEIVEIQNEMLRQREIEERDDEEKTSLLTRRVSLAAHTTKHITPW